MYQSYCIVLHVYVYQLVSSVFLIMYYFSTGWRYNEYNKKYKYKSPIQYINGYSIGNGSSGILNNYMF